MKRVDYLYFSVVIYKWYSYIMNIIVYTNSGSYDEYFLSQNASSKNEIFESIRITYTDDDLDRIEIHYDDIEVNTLDGQNKTESGAISVVHTIDELRTELGKYTG